MQLKFQATQIERFGDRAQYKIPQDGVQSLSHTFAALEKGMLKVTVVLYSLDSV